MNASAQPSVETHSWHVGRLVIAWIVAALAAVSVLMFAPPEQRFEWLAVALGVSTLVSFALQLGTADKVGFITRTAFSVVGAVLIIALVEGGALLYELL